LGFPASPDQDFFIAEAGAHCAASRDAGLLRAHRMTTIDRYILREWLKILVLVLCATMGLLLMQAMYDDFGDLLDDGAGATDVVMYFAVKLPSYLSIVLPLSLLISLLYALGVLHRGNEIIALRAAGVGVGRITRSLWVAGVLLSGLTWYVNANVIPWSVEASRSILETLRFRAEAGAMGAADRVGASTGVAFDNQRQNRMWFFNRYSRFTHRGYGVTVSELDVERREKTRLHAREAAFDARRGCWVFKDGRETWLEPETGEVTRTVAFDEKVVPYFQEDPALMLVFDLKPSDLSFFELRRIIEYFTIEDNPKVTPYAVRYFGLLAETFGPLIILAIAIPFAVSGVRVNPAVGVSKSIGFFLLYFLLAKAATALGGREVISPLWAAIAPNLAMLGIGVGLFARMR